MQNISNRKKKQKKIFSKQNCRRRTERVVSQLDKLRGFHLKSEPPGWEQLLQQCLPEQNYRGHWFPGLRLQFTYVRTAAKCYIPSSAEIYGLPREPKDFLAVSASGEN